MIFTNDEEIRQERLGRERDEYLELLVDGLDKKLNRILASIRDFKKEVIERIDGLQEEQRALHDPDYNG